MMSRCGTYEHDLLESTLARIDIELAERDSAHASD